MLSRRFAGLLLGLSLSAPAAWATESKLSCPEVEATEAKCKNYDADTLACDGLVQAEIKNRIEAAKKELDECKKKNSIGYPIKCKKEIKNATSTANMPKQVASGPIQKELVAKADSPCAKAETLGKESPVCKGPKKVLEVMKANCIKAP